jgi:hypothetical protein
MSSRIITIVLSVGLTFSLAILVLNWGAWHLPGNQQGYEPEQPIAFSHRLHAGELQVSCLYCHSGAESSRHAGIPAASTCMNCHTFLTATLGAVRAEDEQAKTEGRAPRQVVSPELQKLYDALALNEQMQPDPAKAPSPIAWTRVYRLPDFAYFNHSAHVNAGVACQQCHGPVETMERVRQIPNLTMGWCVNCHRAADQGGAPVQPVRTSTDCATCHY